MNKDSCDEAVGAGSAVDLGRRDALKAIGAGTMAAGTGLIGGVDGGWVVTDAAYDV